MSKGLSVLKDIGITLLFVFAATILGGFFQYWHLDESNAVIVYILSVLLTARFTKGYIYGIGATVLSFLLFNWFFTEPYYSLKVNNPTSIITIVIMTITAIITSALTSKVKQAAAQAREKELESNALYQMTNYLTDAENNDKIASVTVETISRLFSCNAAFICCDEKGIPCSNFIQQKENGRQIHRELEQTVAFQKQMEALHTSFKVGPEFYDFPVYGRTMLLGILRIPCDTAENLTKAQTRLLHSMIESVSLALDRFRSLQAQTKSQEETTQERYRGNLLRAISHDLRTPLSGIMGTSEMIMGMTEAADPRYSLAQDIFKDADWLHGLVENILNLTKFQDGHLPLKKEPEAVEEVVGAALQVIEKRMPTREIAVSIPDTLLMVPMDARLITQVLVNLLDNAAKHTPPEEEIAVLVEEDQQNDMAIFSVVDHGCGIPEDAISRIFQMFYTVGNHETTSKQGVGLGLSICQSIVEAHGGSISAENRPEGGAKFVFTLPLGGNLDE